MNGVVIDHAEKIEHGVIIKHAVEIEQFFKMLNFHTKNKQKNNADLDGGQISLKRLYLLPIMTFSGGK